MHNPPCIFTCDGMLDAKLLFAVLVLAVLLHACVRLKLGRPRLLSLPTKIQFSSQLPCQSCCMLELGQCLNNTLAFSRLPDELS